MGDERERMAQDIESYRRERKQLQAENARLRAALEEAAVMVADWGAYADPYFKEKWGLEDDIAKLRAAAVTGVEDER